MSKKPLLLIALVALLLSIGNTCWMVLQYRDNGRTVVIDVIRVFNEFNLKKDLENRVAVKLNDYSNQIDSLKGVYAGLLKNGAPKETAVTVLAQLDTLQYKTQHAYEISNKNINEQVWKRLNTLITAYGKQHHYRLVIGANGMGTVLYNEPSIDKTEELIGFINKQYETGH